MSEDTEGGAALRRPLMEIVPNFSEGRRRDVIDAIVGGPPGPRRDAASTCSGTRTTTGWIRP